MLETNVDQLTSLFENLVSDIRSGRVMNGHISFQKTGQVFEVRGRYIVENEDTTNEEVVVHL